MRDTFSSKLVDLAHSDPKLLLLTGDHGYGLFNSLREARPQQFINMGIAEQNMVGVAAGLSRVGFKPIVYGLSAFIPIRVLEQIKLDVCHDNLPVIFIGDGAGFVYSHLGTSHQSTEDIAVTRAIPNLIVMSPGDRFELARCIDLAYDSNLPVYIRLGKADRGDVHSKNLIFNLGDLIHLKEPDPSDTRVTLVATGSMLKMASLLCESFPSLGLVSAPSLKPINARHIKDLCEKNHTIITLEEHSIYGGLGSIISDVAASMSHATVKKLGIQDRFSEHCGSYEYLLSEHKIDFESLKVEIYNCIYSSEQAAG
jgi:transketolase